MNLQPYYTCYVQLTSVYHFFSSQTNDEKLVLYAYYKQATVGDNTTPAPGMFDLTGKAKWNAWNDKKGLSTEDAMNAYIDEVEKLKAVYA